MHDLPSILLSYGVELKQRGDQYTCKCIAHDDHNPSMSVYINGTGKYTTHCHSCGFHEDAAGVVAYMENITQGEALHRLNDPEWEGKGRYAKIILEPTYKKPERTMLVPPADAPVPKMDWLRVPGTNEPFGDPVAVWVFRTAEGHPLMYEARYMVNGKKEPRCFSFGRRGEAPAKWECSHHLPPRPIYGLDKVASLKGQVAVFEGCRKAEYAQKLIPSIACTAWTGGAKSWGRSDWLPIAGRTVLLFPDADNPGREGIAALAQHLVGLGCTAHIVDDAAKQDGWDICDSEWTAADFVAWAKANKGEKVTKQEIVVDTDPEPSRPEVIQPQPPIEAYIHDGIVWQPPQDVFSELQAPQIQPRMLPEAIRDWMVDTAPIVGVDPSILALSAIVCSAAVMHDGIKLQPEKHNPGWTESARLWGAIIGDSSIKKSPAIKRAKSRLEKIQIDLSKQAAMIEDDYKSKEMAYEIQRKEYIKNLAAKKDCEKPMMAELPEIPRLMAEDVTVEKLAQLLKSNGRGMFVYRDELAGWFGSHDAYKSGGGDRAAWLESYNGGPRYVDRVGSGSTFVPNWGCSMLGGIQPDAMRKIVDKLPEDGLLQRFIIVQGRPGKEGNEAHYSKEANDRYKDMLDSLFNMTPASDNIQLSPEANETRKEIVRYAFKLMECKMISPGFCSWLGKTEGLSARLMLTYHGIECASKGTHPNSHYISASTAMMVHDLWNNFLLPHAIAFYINIVGFSEIGKHVKKLAELCLTAETGEISNREFLHGWIGWRHVKDWDQHTVIQQLIDQGWILPHPLARNTTKGFPTRFLINPELSKYHADRKYAEISRRALAVEAIESARGH